MGGDTRVDTCWHSRYNTLSLINQKIKSLSPELHWVNFLFIVTEVLCSESANQKVPSHNFPSREGTTLRFSLSIFAAQLHCEGNQLVTGGQAGASVGTTFIISSPVIFNTLTRLLDTIPSILNLLYTILSFLTQLFDTILLWSQCFEL